jgi:CRP-like cAMP-binding protein
MPTKSILLVRNSRVEEDLVDQLFNSSEKRLAQTLLLLAHFGKEGRPEPIMAKVSQETLAEMIGTTRSHAVTSGRLQHAKFFHGWNSEQLLWVEC